MDRNKRLGLLGWLRTLSLSARRAWIEIPITGEAGLPLMSLSARRAWIEIAMTSQISVSTVGRSPQGERG